MVHQERVKCLANANPDTLFMLVMTAIEQSQIV